jgi:hypothetical protein
MIRDLSIADSKLNAEGEKGWELVAIHATDANTVRAFFKMPVEGEVEEVQTEISNDRALVSPSPFDVEAPLKIKQM